MFDHFTTLCMGGLSGNKISVFFFYLLESSDKVYKLWSSLNAILENHFTEIDSSRGDSQILEKCFMLNGTKNCQGRVGCDFFRELKRIWA